ncbi:hypothetical protein DFH09DRAFT_1289544 [Mycena vulgaris]|nr:hypothetical protein DFH09DRAFT_1289544 [Mycena vulgaris]
MNAPGTTRSPEHNILFFVLLIQLHIAGAARDSIYNGPRVRASEAPSTTGSYYALRDYVGIIFSVVLLCLHLLSRSARVALEIHVDRQHSRPLCRDSHPGRTATLKANTPRNGSRFSPDAPPQYMFANRRRCASPKWNIVARAPPNFTTQVHLNVTIRDNITDQLKSA